MLLGLSYTSLALGHTKSASFGDGRSHPASICVGCPSFGARLELPSNPPQHHPAPAPCTSSPQFDLYGTAAPRLVLSQQGLRGAWSPPALGCPLVPARGIPSPCSPPQSTSKLPPSLGSTSVDRKRLSLAKT